MLLNAKPKQKQGTKHAEGKIAASSPWWANPFYYCLLYLLPFYFLTVTMAGPYMEKLGQRVNNMTSGNVMLGAFSILLFALGGAPFCFGGNRQSTPAREYDVRSVNLALSLMGTLSLLCDMIYFAPVATHPMALLKFFTGNSSAMYEVRGAMAQIPGVTSFMAACLPFFSLYSAMTMGNQNSGISRYNQRLFYALFFFIVARALIGSERLALVEGAVAYGVPRAVFVWQKSKLRTYLPFIGIVGVFLLFCAGEFFRSWQYYKDFYDSFWEFITVRFFGYFATSINNGAGVMTYFPPAGMPDQTVSGFYALLRIFGLNLAPSGDKFGRYLTLYSTPEFNNPGGLFVPYMDYGVLIGLLVFILMGMLTGLLYRKFLARRPVGLLLYPMWFLALLDVIRNWIWGSSRFVPVILVSMAMVFVIKTARPVGKLSKTAK